MQLALVKSAAPGAAGGGGGLLYSKHSFIATKQASVAHAPPGMWAARQATPAEELRERVIHTQLVLIKLMRCTLQQMSGAYLHLPVFDLSRGFAAFAACISRHATTSPASKTSLLWGCCLHLHRCCCLWLPRV
jgi:hypothetical protein